jgi:hypothetical protein
MSSSSKSTKIESEAQALEYWKDGDETLDLDVDSLINLLNFSLHFLGVKDAHIWVKHELPSGYMLPDTALKLPFSAALKHIQRDGDASFVSSPMLKKLVRGLVYGSGPEFRAAAIAFHSADEDKDEVVHSHGYSEEELSEAAESFECSIPQAVCFVEMMHNLNIGDGAQAQARHLAEGFLKFFKLNPGTNSLRSCFLILNVVFKRYSGFRLKVWWEMINNKHEQVIQTVEEVLPEYNLIVFLLNMIFLGDMEHISDNGWGGYYFYCYCTMEKLQSYLRKSFDLYRLVPLFNILGIDSSSTGLQETMSSVWFSSLKINPVKIQESSETRLVSLYHLLMQLQYKMLQGNAQAAEVVWNLLEGQASNQDASRFGLAFRLKKMIKMSRHVKDEKWREMTQNYDDADQNDRVIKSLEESFIFFNPNSFNWNQAQVEFGLEDYFFEGQTPDKDDTDDQQLVEDLLSSLVPHSEDVQYPHPKPPRLPPFRLDALLPHGSGKEEKKPDVDNNPNVPVNERRVSQAWVNFLMGK